MAVIIFPISNTRANYEFTTKVDGVEYAYNFRYNLRATTWVMTISDEAKNPIITGIPIRVNQDVLEQYRAYPIPQGFLLCVNNRDGVSEPTRDDFSIDTVILYNEV
jgi:hypothetical protein